MKRKPSELSNEDIIDTIIDGYIDDIPVEELFDETDITLKDHLRLFQIGLALTQHPELLEMMVGTRKAERKCETCKNKNDQSCPRNAQSN